MGLLNKKLFCQINGEDYQICESNCLDENAVSFKNIVTGNYLRQTKSLITESPFSDVESFKQDSSFFPEEVSSDTFFLRSANPRYLNQYIGFEDNILKLVTNNKLSFLFISAPQLGEQVIFKNQIFVLCPDVNSNDNYVSLYSNQNNSYYTYLPQEYEHSDNSLTSLTRSFKIFVRRNQFYLIPYDVTNDKALSDFSSNLEFTQFSNLLSKSDFKTEIDALKKSTDIVLNMLQHLNQMFNYNFPVSKVEPANGKLRDLQIEAAGLLSIFDRICRFLNIDYWIFSGTLIGAVRHKGFIPWDDDIDICIMNEDFVKLREYIKNENFFRIKDFQPYAYKFFQNGSRIWLDIYVHYYKSNKISDLEHKTKFKNIKKDAFKILETKGLDEFRQYVNEQLSTISSKTKTDIIFKGLQNYRKNYALTQTDDIFPLTELEFEGFTVKAPKEYMKLLTESYGDIYSYPKTIAPKHLKL